MVEVEVAQPRTDAFFLYYPSRRQIRPPLKAFTEFLRETYRQTRGVERRRVGTCQVAPQRP